MPEELVITALQRAFFAHPPTLSPVVHSDRGGQCYDNALPGTTQAESRWSRLKTEELEAQEWPVFADLADAQASIADCSDY
jgi:putative transposase